jgi:NAD(P)-dependent dehydrogenase (short-subunit alcohol dehydrogenase family)
VQPTWAGPPRPGSPVCRQRQWHALPRSCVLEGVKGRLDPGLTAKVALIAGTGQGTEFPIVSSVAEGGSQVGVFGVEHAALAVARPSAHGTPIHGGVADVIGAHQVERVAAKCASGFGRGRSPRRRFLGGPLGCTCLKASIDDWLKDFQPRVFDAARMAQALFLTFGIKAAVVSSTSPQSVVGHQPLALGTLLQS